jgi:hypothetical protein
VGVTPASLSRMIFNSLSPYAQSKPAGADIPDEGEDDAAAVVAGGLPRLSRCDKHATNALFKRLGYVLALSEQDGFS